MMRKGLQLSELDGRSIRGARGTRGFQRSLQFCSFPGTEQNKYKADSLKSGLVVETLIGQSFRCSRTTQKRKHRRRPR